MAKEAQEDKRAWEQAVAPIPQWIGGAMGLTSTVSPAYHNTTYCNAASIVR